MVRLTNNPTKSYQKLTQISKGLGLSKKKPSFAVLKQGFIITKKFRQAPYFRNWLTTMINSTDLTLAL